MKYSFRNLQNRKAPDDLKARTLAAAQAARENEPQHIAAPRIFGMAKRIVAAACAFAVIIGGVTVWQTRQTGAPAGATAAGVVANTFGIVAYAADTGEALPVAQKSTLVFDKGNGVGDSKRGFFSGCLFRLTGDNIASFRAELSKGGLYRQQTYSYTKQETDDLFAKAAAQGKDVLIDGADQTITYTADKVTTAFTVLDSSAEETYDPALSYGFWLNGAEYQAQAMDESDDLQGTWHDWINSFEGVRMTLTVTFTDGTQQTQNMILHTGKLACEYVDGVDGPQLTGAIVPADDAEAPYIYGVYAEIQ